MASNGDVSAWAIVARYTTVSEAEVAASSLDAAGIDSDLIDEHLVRTDWMLSQALGGVKLVVRASDLEAARQLLDAPIFGEAQGMPLPSISSDADRAHLRCPACGAGQPVPIPRVRIFMLFSAVFMGLGVVVGEPALALTAFVGVAAAVLLLPSMRCVSCSHRWTPAEGILEAPLPSASDIADDICPRCGSIEVHRIDHRRLKAIPMLFSAAMLVVLPMWLLSPKRRCDACGLEI